MPKLSKLKNRPILKDAVIDFGDGDILTACVDANKFTYRLEKDMMQAIKDDDVDRVAELLFVPLVSWDLTDDDGKVLPMSTETVEDLGNVTVRTIFESISGAINPNSKTSTS